MTGIIYSMTEKLKLLRIAGEKEKNYYFNTLYPIQDKVFEAIHTKVFYLTGGTALSRFHYRHRFSDDLDFFYDGFNHPKENFNFSYREIVYDLEKKFEKIDVSIDGEFFKRLFIYDHNAVLKVEFVYENFKTVGDKKEFKGILVDSKENICANKIGTVSDKRAVKDFLDLFFLLEDIDLARAIEWSELKKVPLDYEGLLTATGDVLKKPYLLEGEVLTIHPIDNDEFIAFTNKLIKDLLSHAKNI